MILEFAFFFPRRDYIKHALDKPRSFKPEEVYVPRGDFESMTSYNKEYTRKYIFETYISFILVFL